jgi:hypothetical protein
MPEAFGDKPMLQSTNSHTNQPPPLLRNPRMHRRGLLPLGHRRAPGRSSPVPLINPFPLHCAQRLKDPWHHKRVRAHTHGRRAGARRTVLPSPPCSCASPIQHPARSLRYHASLKLERILGRWRELGASGSARRWWECW